MILLIGGEKGGTGKTTVATNIAAMRTRTSTDVLLVDTDGQATASHWCTLRDDRESCHRVACIQKSGKSVRAEVLALQPKYKDIIVDAGGRDSAELRASLLVANKAIFPLRPSQFDLWTLERMNSLVDIAKEYNEELTTFVVLNQCPPNPAAKEILEARALLADFHHLILMNSHLCERIVFRRAALFGMTVVEYKPEDTKANTEMWNLYEEIFNA